MRCYSCFGVAETCKNRTGFPPNRWSPAWVNAARYRLSRPDMTVRPMIDGSEMRSRDGVACLMSTRPRAFAPLALMHRADK